MGKELDGLEKNLDVMKKQFTEDWWPDIQFNNERLVAAIQSYDVKEILHLLWAYNTSTVKHLYRVVAVVWPVVLGWTIYSTAKWLQL